jgi:hypothetical protein
MKQTFEYSPKAAIIHLIGTVENNNELAEASSHILYCFGFSSSSGTCGRTAQ